MSPADHWKIVIVLGPIISLLVLGFWLTMRSGVVELASWQSVRRMAQNASQAVLLTVICLVALAAVQQLVGFRMALMW